MIVFTCNEFQYELSTYQVSQQYVNSWFSENLFSVLTFPIDLNIEGYFDKYKDHGQIRNLPKSFDGFLNVKGKVSKAIWKIMDISESKIRISIESGLDQFPSWDIKLSALKLDTLTVSNIREHARIVTGKKYPEVNYNFPMIHTDYYDENSATFSAFEKVYNKFENGSFVLNSVDLENNKIYNRNIMRAFPYILHIVENGLKLGNCTLHGDIINDDDFKKTLLIPGKPIELKDRPESVSIIMGLDSITREGFTNTIWELSQEILLYGKFRLKGYVSKIIRDPNIFKLFLDDILIYENYSYRQSDVDIVFSTKKNGSVLKIFKQDSYTTSSVFEADLIPIELYDEMGEQIQYSVDSNVIDLNLNVPDVTFGDLMSYIIAQKNYSFDLLNGNEIHMNKLDEKILPTDAIDLRKYSVKKYNRNYSEISSFELKYSDTGNEKYPAQSLYYDENGVNQNNYTVKDETKTIEIKAIPLPIETSKAITTSRLITNDETKICFALYDGLTNGFNFTKNIDDFNILSVLENNYRRWFDFQLNSITYNFVFRKNIFDEIEFNEKTKIFAYQNYHFISEMNVNRINPQVEEISIKTFTIRP